MLHTLLNTPCQTISPPSTSEPSSTILRHQTKSNLLQVDVRQLALMEDLRQAIDPLLLSFPITTPFDLWTWLEPAFVPLTLSRAATLGSPIIKDTLYQELNEFVNWQFVPDGRRVFESCKKNLGKEDPRNRRVDQLEGAIRTLMDGIHTVISTQNDYLAERRKCIEAIVKYAILAVSKLSEEQFLDGIEEIFISTGDKRILTIDDGTRVVAIEMDVSEVERLFEKRSSYNDELVYPFSSTSEITSNIEGPFCHICREYKPDLGKCTAKLHGFYSDGVSKCHRRYCYDCLKLYNYPLPSPTHWYCPVCSKICTCDRCVRLVYIENIKSFLIGLGKEIPSIAKPEGIFIEPFSDFLTQFPTSHFAVNSNSNSTQTPRRILNFADSNSPKLETDLETPLTIDFLTSHPPTRIKEMERSAHLLKILKSIKDQQNLRLTVLRDSLKEYSDALSNHLGTVKKVGSSGKQIDKILSDLPEISFTISSNEEGEGNNPDYVTAENPQRIFRYLKLLDSLTGRRTAPLIMNPKLAKKPRNK
jgi:hypothetical protein